MDEKRKQEHEEMLERRRYGRLWMQDGYFNEGNREQWLKTAEILKSVNEHVIEDIEDYFLLEAFGDMDKEQIAKIIDADQHKQIKEQKTLLIKSKTDKAKVEEF